MSLQLVSVHTFEVFAHVILQRLIDLGTVDLVRCCMFGEFEGKHVKMKVFSVAFIVAWAMSALSAGNASAAMFDDRFQALLASCDPSDPPEKIIRNFETVVPSRSLPLRCGTAAYGARHLAARGRDDTRHRRQIPLTLKGTFGGDDGPTARVWDTENPSFRVVGDYGNYADGLPKGLISAYFR